MEIPQTPVVFTKFPNCLVGPRADVMLSSAFVDWEVELVVVIGRRGQRIGESDPKGGQADEHDQQLPAHVVHSMPWLARYCATFFRRDHQ